MVSTQLTQQAGAEAGVEQLRLLPSDLENNFHSWEKQKQNLNTGLTVLPGDRTAPRVPSHSVL